ncbi:hypothetical protein K461DRAFT_284205 [Myriangium duriaei CBS 260.36]|uniref:SET domain-containing protein n=1 Tax=Myriangium duriaei CBS 260.36 TaxID=1168546 RepID=A0A9P4JA35_9PEZI|nr:hypothetical protein K461DRAFT_284205 [Myriangium duriaei CBS 260.36]
MAESRTELQALLAKLDNIRNWLDQLPYSIQLYLEQADSFQRLGYPDLAAGAAYKALLLNDAINDDSDEYYQNAISGFASSCIQLPVELRSAWPPWPAEDPVRLKSLKLNDEAEDAEELDFDHDAEKAAVEWINGSLLPVINLTLARNLYACQCFRSAYKHCQIGLRSSPKNNALITIRDSILGAVGAHFESIGEPSDDLREILDDWPNSGLVRRECYPWNDIEPNRFSSESLDFLNAEMSMCAPKLEVKAVDLPALGGEVSEGSSMIKQLGVFAKEDIQPGESVLKETSLLTANNRLQDALCDACSIDIEDRSLTNGDAAICTDCSVVFCSQECLDTANELYHPAVCDRDVDSIAKDVPPAQAADSLYLLLLLRSLALAETQEVHPLEIKEVKYIWGDYHTLDIARTWRPPTAADDFFAKLPCTLLFNFESNVVLPFHMLTKMDVNIFTDHRRYDVWIFNTLFAKFRGTASARLSGATHTSSGLKLGRRRGPEVSAVHPCWCLANHSCDPNVRWEWGGKVEFTVRERRASWIRLDSNEARSPVVAGIRKGEEVLSHYCDVGLDVQSRREWARGALGGDCRCERCAWEAHE